MLLTNSGIELTAMERDPVSGVYRVRYDPETTPASLAVIAAQARVSGVETTDLAPLHESIDTDALDAITADHDGQTPTLQISFDYEGHTVTVDSRGRLQIGERPRATTEEDRMAVSS
ncbi:MAG: HalOD1 output domain-containing protein [Halobacteriota archaeon]